MKKDGGEEKVLLKRRSTQVLQKRFVAGAVLLWLQTQLDITPCIPGFRAAAIFSWGPLWEPRWWWRGRRVLYASGESGSSLAWSQDYKFRQVRTKGSGLARSGAHLLPFLLVSEAEQTFVSPLQANPSRTSISNRLLSRSQSSSRAFQKCFM